VAYSVREERQSLATILRDRLGEAERAVLQLRRDNAESFLVLLDSIEDCFSQLESSGLDLRPEQTRWLSLQGKLRSDAGRIVRVLDSAGGLRQLRAGNSAAQGMWWRLDEVVAANRRHLIRRLSLTFGTVALVAAMVWAVFEFITVDADTVIASEAVTSVRQLTLGENWGDALAVIEEAKSELTKPNAELLIWEAVVRDKLGQGEIVDDTLAEAIALIEADQKSSYWWFLVLPMRRLVISRRREKSARMRSAYTLLTHRDIFCSALCRKWRETLALHLNSLNRLLNSPWKATHN